MLRRLIYTSRSPQALPLDLKDILESSRKNNPARGLTGAMCFLDGVYLQCLEGESKALDTLYERIEADPRHQNPKLLVREPADKRLFQKWSMALLTWNDETRGIFDYFMPEAGNNLYELEAAKAVLLLEALSISSNWSEV